MCLFQQVGSQWKQKIAGDLMDAHKNWISLIHGIPHTWSHGWASAPDRGIYVPLPRCCFYLSQNIQRWWRLHDALYPLKVHTIQTTLLIFRLSFSSKLDQCTARVDWQEHEPIFWLWIAVQLPLLLSISSFLACLYACPIVRWALVCLLIRCAYMMYRRRFEQAQ